jgi:fimbrial chaperone protein
MYRFLIIALLWMSAATFNADAMRISPLVLEVSPSGSGSSGRIRVENNSPADLPLEVQVFKISVDQNGVISQTPADDDFFVFPPQVVIPSGEPQVIRFQWLGDPNPQMSQAYFVTMNELPIDLEEGASAVQFVYSVSALVNIVPRNAEEDTSLVSAEIVAKEDGAKVVRATFQNDGNKFHTAGQFSWKLDLADAESYTIPEEKVTKAVGMGFIPPGGATRTMEVPLPPEVLGSVLDIEFVGR